MKLFWPVFLVPIVALSAEGATNSLPRVEHLHAGLVAEVKQASTNETFRAAVEIKLDKGWHAYWQNPGDYGDTPKLRWEGGHGFSASPLAWPVPKRIQVGTIVSFGYEDEVLLPFEITPESGFKETTLRLRPQFKWLVCKEVCIPGHATLSLDLPISAQASIADPEYKPKLGIVREMLPAPAPATFKGSGKLGPSLFTFQLAGLPPHTDEISFFPITPDQINYAAEAKIVNTASEIQITLKRSDRLEKSVDHFPALLVLHSPGGESLAYQLDIPLGNPSTRLSAIWLPLLFALLGGLLLNLMPCVFPVLSIKAMSVVKMTTRSARETRQMGWAYTLGILASFWALVGTLIFLRSAGQQIGWGFQLQSPAFVFGLACVLFAFGLNLLGMFEISGRFIGVGSGLANRSGFVGSFFTGVLATVVATPCSAPFMGSAVGFALSQPPLTIFLIFSALGFGLAAPYLLICYIPAIGRLLPRPGAWMATFQQLMGFLVFATILWLAWVLSLQVSASGLVLLLCAFLAIGFAAWMHHRLRSLAWIAPLLGLAVVVALAASLRPATGAGPSASAPSSSTASISTATRPEDPTQLQWEAFSPAAVRRYQTQGRPVFVDFTAAWCVSCQFNEALVFRSEEVKAKLKSLNVALLKGDWTNQDPVITETLHAFGRDGVPFYLIYPKGKDAPAIPLPEVINAGIVLNQLEQLK